MPLRDGRIRKRAGRITTPVSGRMVTIIEPHPGSSLTTAVSGPDYGPGMTTDGLTHVHDGRHDFDFLHGAWHSRQRRLRERLTGCDEWDEFAADLHCTPVLDGAGNFDELTSPVMGYKGLALRLYDETDKIWSIYWLTGGAGGVEPPVVGRFAGGVGDFLSSSSSRSRCAFAKLARTRTTQARIISLLSSSNLNSLIPEFLSF